MEKKENRITTQRRREGDGGKMNGKDKNTERRKIDKDTKRR